MAWNGSGTFSRTNGVYSGSGVWTNDKDAGVKIRSDRHDTHDQDLATGINAALAKNGENTPTANLPMGSYKHTGVAVASGTSSRSEYMSGAAAQDGAHIHGGTTAGSSTVYTATLTPAITAYAAKQMFIVQFDEACGANPTINFNSVGAKKMYVNIAGVATQVTTNDIAANQVSILIYDAALDTAAGAFWMVNNVLPAWVTAAGKALLDDADAAAQRATLDAMEDVLTTRGDIVYRNATVPARLALGANGYVLTSDGTDVLWAAAPSSFPLNHLSGCVLAHAADTDHDITVALGSARDSTNAANIVLAAAITKQIDAAWAVGDAAGGLDTGSVANSTTYYVWLIKRSDTGVVDALFSTSSTAPTMPANYDYKRLVGAVRTDGSANILSGYFRQERGNGVSTFTSGRQTVAFDTLLTLTHMLPGRPQVSRVSIACTSAEQGFATDDELDVSPSQDSDFGTSAAWDATTVQVATGVGIRVINQSTFNNATITAASWRYVIRATYYA